MNPDTLSPLAPRDAAPLLRPLLDELLALLGGLTPEQWLRPTVAGQWRVRDIAAHVIDTMQRRLAIGRDGHRIETGPLESYADVLRLINGLNATGVDYAARLSPRQLVESMARVGDDFVTFVSGLPPDGPALFPVAWAGEAESANWMDIGREYTEHWHHHMQIRDAVGAPRLLLEPRWFHPLMDYSVRVLPVAYGSTAAAPGSSVVLRIPAGAPQAWSLVAQDGRWHLYEGHATQPSTIVTADADTAWRILYHALSPEQARARVAVEGDATLAEPLLRARSVMV